MMAFPLNWFPSALKDKKNVKNPFSFLWGLWYEVMPFVNFLLKDKDSIKPSGFILIFSFTVLKLKKLIKA